MGHPSSSSAHTFGQNISEIARIPPMRISNIPNSFWKVKPDLPECSSGLTTSTGGVNQKRKIPIDAAMTPVPTGWSQCLLAGIAAQNKIPSSTSTTPTNCWRIRTVVSVVFCNMLLIHSTRQSTTGHHENLSLIERRIRQSNSSILFCTHTSDRSNSQPFNSPSFQL